MAINVTLCLPIIRCQQSVATQMQLNQLNTLSHSAKHPTYTAKFLLSCSPKPSTLVMVFMDASSSVTIWSISIITANSVKATPEWSRTFHCSWKWMLRLLLQSLVLNCTVESDVSFAKSRTTYYTFCSEELTRSPPCCCSSQHQHGWWWAYVALWSLYEANNGCLNCVFIPARDSY